MSLVSAVDQLLNWSPVELSAYYLRDTVIKKFKIDDFTYVVMQIDTRTMKGKSLLCISASQADWVFEACVNRIRPMVN